MGAKGIKYFSVKEEGYRGAEAATGTEVKTGIPERAEGEMTGAARTQV